MAILEAGPVNLLALLALTLAMAVAMAVALGRLHWGRPASLIPVAVTMALPLVFSVWSSTWQLEAGIAAANEHPQYLGQLTLYAAALSRSVHTQLLAGLITAAGALTLILGAIQLSVPGDRPRLAVGFAGVGLTALLAVVAALVPSSSSWMLVARVLLYASAGFAATTALIAAHRRGPGVQVGTFAAVAFPLLVAGLDQAGMACLAIDGLTAAAVAPAADKAVLRDALSDSMVLMRWYSVVTLGVALGLAALGPLAASRREPSLAWGHAVAMGLGVALAGLGVGYASSWVLAI